MLLILKDSSCHNFELLFMSEDCSFGSEEFWSHSSISNTGRHSGKGAWWNSEGFAGNAGRFF